ncbi:GNAT family N-acetyltransferase [Paenibacillus harenae]|uniref:GNAT family N-acetyltransferase n=1 Tax=Paenibacillus harenae TaxID=306543 RepID=UPI0027940E35|nr:GNAT family N-acetyltransferase [Paenibacillus harenae]MDQ0060432.1 GNAT superfamily N-acetyltransferase [Paenibacillus harenae]
MTSIEIRKPSAEEYPRVHAFQCEYLDRESFERFGERIAAAPEYYIAAFDGEEVIGVCYGQRTDRADDTIMLQGIAVNLDTSKRYARTGIGSSLIASFERIVHEQGYRRIDLGAADDLKVERFYLKNGYTPYELVAKDASYGEIVRIAAQDYTSGKIMQEQLRDKYQAHEVIIIFRKSLA